MKLNCPIQDLKKRELEMRNHEQEIKAERDGALKKADDLLKLLLQQSSEKSTKKVSLGQF